MSEDATKLSSLCSMVVAAFREVLSWDGACIYLVDDTGTAYAHHLFDMPAEQLTLYHREVKDHDPLSPARFARGSVNVVPLEVAERDFDASIYVDTFLKAYNLPHEVELFFRDQNGQIIAGLGLFRSARNGRFRLPELDLLNRVRPVAECGFRLFVRAGEDRQTSPDCRYGLTRREGEVVELVRRGSSNRAIADALSISVATVKTHLFNAYEKAGVSSRTELLSRLYLHN